MSIIAKILGGRTESEAGPDFLRQELTKAEKACETAKADVAAADAAYKGSLLAVDAKVSTSAKGKLMDAQVAVERAEALVAELRTRFKAACEASAEGERRHRYDEAVKQRNEAINRLGEYPALAEQIATILVDLAHAELSISSTNSDLPSGAEPIESVEVSQRWRPAIPREIISEKVENRWHFASGADAGEPVPERLQADCKARSLNSRIGILARTGPDRPMGEHSTVVVKRRVKKIRYRRAVSVFETRVTPLSAGVSLPPIRDGDAPFWASSGANSFVSADPATWAKQTLARADQLGEMAAEPADDLRGINRPIEEREELLDDDEVIAKAQEFAHSRERVGE